MATYENKIVNQVVNNNDGAIKDLKSQLEAAKDTEVRLNNELERTRSILREVTQELELFKSGKGVKILEEELERFRDSAIRAEEEFRSFLTSVNLDDAWGENDRQFDRLFKQIADGSKTANQAILEVKTNFAYLMEENYSRTGGAFDTQMVQQFTATLERLGDVVTDVSDRIRYMEENGVKSAGGSGGGGSSFANFSTILDQIKLSAEGMSEETKIAYEYITNLVKSVSDYANLDETKILGVSQAFRGLANIGQGSYGTKSVENIISLIKQLQTVSDNGVVRIGLDLTNLQDLKVSKASLRNLAEYLPVIAKVNVNKLKELSNVDLTNFNNIKVSKGAIEEISKIADAIQILKEAKAASVNVNGSGITIDKTVNQALAEQKALEKEVTAATKEWEASQRAAAEQAAQVVTPLQQQINALTGVDRAAKDAKSSWEHMNYEMKEQAGEAKATAQAVAKATSLLAEMTKAKKNWTKARGGQTAEQYANIQKMIPELDTLMKGFHNRDVLPPDFKARIDQLSTSFKENSTQIKAAGENTLSFGDRVQKLSGKFGAWLSITRIIMGVIRTIKQMIKTVVEIDSAMTQLQIVTKATSDTMRGFASNAAKSAKEIGSTITDFTSSVTTFARLGLTT